MLISSVGLNSLFLYHGLPGSPSGGNSIKRCSVLLILLTCQLAINCKEHCTQKGKKKKRSSWISFKFNYSRRIQYIIASNKRKKKNLNL